MVRDANLDVYRHCLYQPLMDSNVMSGLMHRALNQFNHEIEALTNGYQEQEKKIRILQNLLQDN